MRKIFVLAAAALAAMIPLAEASAQIAVLSDPVMENSAVPGQNAQGRLMLKNMSAEPQEARIYQTDYAFSADGRAAYGTPGATPRSNAKWIKLSTGYLVIPPGETVPVSYDIMVPSDSSLKGTYWSMLMVEAITDGSINSRRPPNARVQVGLSVVTRYGTQIATHLGNPGTSRLAFDSLAATTDSTGQRGLRYDFINTGDRAQRYTMSVELYNEAGELVKKASQLRGLLYPGSSARQKFEVGALAHGTYTAVLVADAGGDQVFGGQFKVAY
ncbi:MAG: hypothetical protein ABJE47_07180 [bacterium]